MSENDVERYEAKQYIAGGESKISTEHLVLF